MLTKSSKKRVCPFIDSEADESEAGSGRSEAAASTEEDLSEEPNELDKSLINDQPSESDYGSSDAANTVADLAGPRAPPALVTFTNHNHRRLPPSLASLPAPSLDFPSPFYIRADQHSRATSPDTKLKVFDLRDRRSVSICRLLS